MSVSLLPLHDYLTIPPGGAGYDGTDGIIMPTDESYYEKTGIFTTSDSPSSVFPFNATKFDLSQAVYWYYNIQGYRYGNKQLTFPFGMENKMTALQTFLEAETGPRGDLVPGDSHLYGIVPFFGKATSEPTDFRYTPITFSTIYGGQLGACILSRAIFVIKNIIPFLDEDRLVATTRVTFEDSSYKTFEVSFVTRARTIKTFTEDDILLSTVVQPEYVSTELEATSFLTTYPIQPTNYFYDAYGLFSGFYDSDSLLEQTVNEYNSTSVVQYQVTPVPYPQRISNTLTFNGVTYYQVAYADMPNYNSHRIVG